MEFAEYRSESLKLLWPKVKQEIDYSQMAICYMEDFRPWEVDNICANNWKTDNPVEFCADMLLSYVREVVENL